MDANQTPDNRRLSLPAYASASTPAGDRINQPNPLHFFQKKTAIQSRHCSSQESLCLQMQHSQSRQKHCPALLRCGASTFVDQHALQLYDEVFEMMYTTDIVEGSDDIQQGYNAVPEPARVRFSRIGGEIPQTCRELVHIHTS